MLEIKRRMIRAAARDGRDERWLQRPQVRGHLRGQAGVGGQLAADDHAGLRDLRGHERLAHHIAPSNRT